MMDEVENLLKGCFIAVDKPRGPPSAQVGSWVRDMLGAKKSGHIGTLDPKVSGVLIIAIGKAVKLSKFLSGEDKEYIAVMHLHKEIDKKKIADATRMFTGIITQKPPLRSAVAKKKRKRRIYWIKLLEIDGKNVLMHVRCEGGTYIRKLIHDMGVKLGAGANMLELRRVKSGSVGEDMIHSLYDIKDAVWLWKHKGDDSLLKSMLIPPSMLLNMEKIIVKNSAVPSIAYGSPIYRKGIIKYPQNARRGDYAKVLSQDGAFCGTAIIADGNEMYAKIDVNWLDAKKYSTKWRK